MPTIRKSKMSHPSSQMAVTLGGALIIASLLAPITMNQCSEMDLRTAREEQSQQHIAAGDKALQDDQAIIAEKAYGQALALAPTNQDARRGLHRAQATRIVNASESVSKEDAYGLLYRFEAMVDSDTEYSETYRLALGALYSALGDVDKAEASYAAATASDTPTSKAWAQRGGFELSQKDYDAAIASYEKALASDSKNHPARLGLGIALKQQKKIKRAIDELVRASGEIEGPKVWYELGDAYLIDGNFEKAYTALETAATKHPQVSKEPSLLKRLGVAAYQTEKFAAAVQYLQSAAQVEPTLETLLNLGIAYHKTGKFTASSNTLARVIQANPADAEARSYLMSSLVKLGKIQEARTVGTDFLALAQNRPAMQQDAAAIQGLLQQLKAAQTNAVSSPNTRPRLPPPQRGPAPTGMNAAPPMVPVPGDTLPPPSTPPVPNTPSAPPLVPAGP